VKQNIVLNKKNSMFNLPKTQVILFSFLLIVLTNVNSFAQISYLDKQWEQDYGMTFNSEHSDFVIDATGNLYYSVIDNNIVKIFSVTPGGGIIWNTTVLNPSASADIIDLELTSDQNLLLLTQEYNGQDIDIHIHKFSLTGNLIWTNSSNLPLNSKFLRIQEYNNNVFILGSKNNLTSEQLFIKSYQYSNGQSAYEYTQGLSNNFYLMPVDFSIDYLGNLIVLSKKQVNSTSFSHIQKFSNTLSLINELDIEISTGQHIPKAIRTYMNYCVVVGQKNENGNNGVVHALELSSMNVLGSFISDLPKSIYKDIELINNQIYVTGNYIDSIGNQKIVIESVSLNYVSLWRKIIASPVNDVDFGGIDIVEGVNNSIYIIADGIVHQNSSKDWLIYELDNSGEITGYYRLDRAGQLDINQKIIATPLGVWVSGETTDINSVKSTIVKLKSYQVDTIPNFDGEIEPVYYGYIKNNGQLKSFSSSNDYPDKVSFYSSGLKYVDGITNEHISFTQMSLVDSIQKLYNVNRSDLVFINGDLNNLVERVPNELKRNFFSSNNNKGIVEVREFRDIYIPKIYPYTDLKINHNSSGIKFTFAKGKRGDLSNIEINWNGISSFEILNGKLIVHNGIGIIDFEPPIAYQISVTNVITSFQANYYINANGNIAINVSGYNPFQTLYIVMKDGNQFEEPVKLLGDNLQWSTYFGLNGQTTSRDVCTDKFGNAYYSGETNEVNVLNAPGIISSIPYTGGLDAFLLKFNELIEPVWFSFYGGEIPNYTSPEYYPDESGAKIACTENGTKIYISGMTKSTDLPLANINQTGFTGDQSNTCGATYQNCFDVFIAHFDQNGQLIWSSYYGGDDREVVFDIHIDQAENAYVVGSRSSLTNLIPLANATNVTTGRGMLLKFNSLDDLTWVNGWDCEQISSITSDNSNRIYIAGTTKSLTMPVLYNPITIPQTQSFNGGAIDGFLAVLTDQGVLSHSMYYGGNCGDGITGLDSDNSGAIYAIGKTAYPQVGNNSCTGSTDLPVIGNGFPMPGNSSNNINHFIFKTRPITEGVPIVISDAGYFGGGGQELELTGEFGLSYTEASVTVSKSGICSISGATNSSSILSPKIQMPTIQPQDFYVQYDKNLSQNLSYDAYLAVFDENFELKYSTYFGNGQYSDGPSGISFSEFDNRLFYAGNTGTLNELNCQFANDYLYLEEYDDISANDFFLGTIIGTTTPFTQTTWFAMFDLDGLEIPSNESNTIAEMNQSIKIYPNPTNQVFNLETDDSEFKILIGDLSGKIIFANNYTNKKVEIDLNQFSSGTYILKYLSNNHNFDKIIIKL
jgi:hypothetical protein